MEEELMIHYAIAKVEDLILYAVGQLFVSRVLDDDTEATVVTTPIKFVSKHTPAVIIMTVLSADVHVMREDGDTLVEVWRGIGVYI